MSEQPRVSYVSETLEASEHLIRYNRWVMSALSGDIRGRTLEIGAGIGTMSAYVRPQTSEFVVVEPADNLCEMLDACFTDDRNVTVRYGLLQELVSTEDSLFESGFDTVVSFNVLEHVEDHVGLLRTQRELLRPGGRVCIFVPSGPALYGTLDAQVDHKRRYTRETLEQAFRDAGLEPMRIEYFDLLGTIRCFLVGRVLKRTTTGAGAGRYDRPVIPVCKLAVRLLGPPRRKNLVVVARAAE